MPSSQLLPSVSCIPAETSSTCVPEQAHSCTLPMTLFPALPLGIFHLSEVTLGEQMVVLSSLLSMGKLQRQQQKAGSNYCASWMTPRV